MISLIGVFIITNKNLKGHPYPMIAYAILASAAYIASYSKMYLAINAMLFEQSEDKRSPVITMFIYCWKFLLNFVDDNFKMFDLSEKDRMPRRYQYQTIMVLNKSFGF